MALPPARESLTQVEATHAPDAACEPLTGHYDDKQVPDIVYAIARINAGTAS
jgi:alkylhydroperoxidase family enzyme